MRHVAISALILVSLTAGCGDSDDKKKEEVGVDAGGSENGNANGTTPPGEDDEDLDNECDYDPCCFANEDYDFERCNGMRDGGMKDSSVSESDAATDAGTDAGVDAAAGGGKTE